MKRGVTENHSWDVDMEVDSEDFDDNDEFPVVQEGTED
jgi:hypothetical protein